MKLIDSHAHIYVADWGEDQQAMILRAMDAGVEAVIMPHIDEETSEVLLQLYQNYPDWCWPAMGLHPCSVKDDFRNSWMTMRSGSPTIPFPGRV